MDEKKVDGIRKVNSARHTGQ